MKKKTDNRLWAWKAVDVDFTTRNGFQWPFPRGIAKDHTDFGLSLSKDFSGAAFRGSSTHLVLVCSYLAKDVVEETSNKIRVKQCSVELVWDAHKLIIKFGRGADLQGADLQGADLQYADLQYADLQGANLQYANLRGADLQGANLRGADLQGANLRGADLYGADLRAADLQYADLRGADMYGTGLTNAIGYTPSNA